MNCCHIVASPSDQSQADPNHLALTQSLPRLRPRHRRTRPTSLRPRSTSMTCSARSFSSASRSFSSARSSSSVRPRHRVPANGLRAQAFAGFHKLAYTKRTQALYVRFFKGCIAQLLQKHLLQTWTAPGYGRLDSSTQTSSTLCNSPLPRRVRVTITATSANTATLGQAATAGVMARSRRGSVFTGRSMRGWVA